MNVTAWKRLLSYETSIRVEKRNCPAMAFDSREVAQATLQAEHAMA